MTGPSIHSVLALIGLSTLCCCVVQTMPTNKPPDATVPTDAQLPEHIVRPGGTVVLECPVPEIVYKAFWKKMASSSKAGYDLAVLRGRVVYKVHHANRKARLIDNKMFAVTVTNVQPADAGIYECSGKDTRTTVMDTEMRTLTKVRVVVMQELEGAETSVLSGGVVECPTPPDTLPGPVWIFKSSMPKLTPMHKQVPGQSSPTITSTRGKIGDYVCAVRGDDAQLTVYRKVRVEPTKISAYVGSSVDLRCLASDDSHPLTWEKTDRWSSSGPYVLYRNSPRLGTSPSAFHGRVGSATYHGRNGKINIHYRGFFPDVDGAGFGAHVTTVYRVSPRDMGLYVCRTGPGDEVSGTYQLEVTSHPFGIQCLNPGQDLVFKIKGTKADSTVLCSVNPPPDVVPRTKDLFLYTGFRFSDMDEARTSVTFMDNGYITVTHKNVTLEDTGEYTCGSFPTPYENRESDGVVVIVQPQPTYRQVTVSAGKEYTFECPASDRTPYIGWFREYTGILAEYNGAIYSDGLYIGSFDQEFHHDTFHRRITTQDDNSVSVTLRGLTRGDSGRYYCDTVNAIGQHDIVGGVDLTIT